MEVFSGPLVNVFFFFLYFHCNNLLLRGAEGTREGERERERIKLMGHFQKTNSAARQLVGIFIGSGRRFCEISEIFNFFFFFGQRDPSLGGSFIVAHDDRVDQLINLSPSFCRSWAC